MNSSTTTEVGVDRTAPAIALPERLARGAVGGILAGLVFIVVTMWFASSLPMGQPGNPLRLISTIVKGKGALMDGTASVGTGWIVHLVLSAIFGMIFAFVVPLLPTNGLIALAGGVYGGLLFVVNFLLIGEYWLTQFQATNRPFELAIHIVFGHLLAVAFYRSELGRRRSAST